MIKDIEKEENLTNSNHKFFDFNLEKKLSKVWLNLNSISRISLLTSETESLVYIYQEILKEIQSINNASLLEKRRKYKEKIYKKVAIIISHHVFQTKEVRRSIINSSGRFIESNFDDYVKNHLPDVTIVSLEDILQTFLIWWRIFPLEFRFKEALSYLGEIMEIFVFFEAVVKGPLIPKIKYDWYHVIYKYSEFFRESSERLVDYIIKEALWPIEANCLALNKNYNEFKYSKDKKEKYN